MILINMFLETYKLTILADVLASAITFFMIYLVAFNEKFKKMKTIKKILICVILVVCIFIMHGISNLRRI
ncbi:hypothetical protein CSC2_49190 [Clostridium zeae]|uniref:Uncharacterized protein n=1 Tax=Clostridium zeae TaxID=2759022 RepID=A0ABQ1EID6_9CLOT|nr:hypothetical protein [Clostridium zeae]GFZ34393.1 hypothetical protein CSC2_49190 [Clostridium zeae]